MIAINLAGPPPDSADECRKVVEAIRNGSATEAYDLHLLRWRRSTDSFPELLTKNGMHQTVAALEVRGAPGSLRLLRSDRCMSGFR